VIPETDQQVGRKPHALPAKEHLNEIVGRHQHQHRKGEQRQIGEEARLAGVFGHVTPAVHMHQRRHRRHDDEHHCRQRVNAQAPVDDHVARTDPVEHWHDVRCNIGHDEKVEENSPCQRARRKQCACRNDLRRRIANDSPAKTGNQRRQQWQEDKRLNHPRILFASSTEIVARPRK